MSDSTIGIKIADGSYYPVLEHGFSGKKRLTLTTVKDSQKKVQIDLYRGNGASLSEAQYIGSIVVENIPPARKGEPEIELTLGIDPEGQFSAEACDDSTGECQRFDTNLGPPSEKDLYEEPEFATEGEPQEEFGLEEQTLTGEDYPVSDADRRKDVLHRKPPNLLLLVLFVILGVALVVALAYFVYRGIQGPQVPALSQAAPGPTSTQQQAQEGASGQAASAPAAGTEPAPVTKGGASYTIKIGDTLWDISSTYYRNPWLYPKLAKANSIRNPDLIFAGTRIFIPEN